MFDLQRLVRLFSAAIVRRPLRFALPLVLITVAFGLRIPELKVDPRPERLMASIQDFEGADARFVEAFGEEQSAIAVIVEGDNLLAREKLQFLHDLSLHFAKQPWVTRVESLTVSSLPRATAAPQEETGAADSALGIDASEETDVPGDANDEISDADDDTLTLDDLNEETERGVASAGRSEAARQLDQAEAFRTLVEASPAWFPGGYDAALARVTAARLRFDAPLQGEKVDEHGATKVRDAVAQVPMVMGRLISRDHRVAVVAIRLRDRVSSNFDEMRSLLSGAQADLEAWDKPPGVEANLTGIPHLRNEIVTRMQRDQKRLVPLNLVVCAVLLVFTFRWWPGVALPLMSVLLTLAGVIGAMAVFGEQMSILSNIIPPLLIIIGISDSIHLIARYIDELRAGHPQAVAVERSLSNMAVACFFTSLTTAVGLASLGTARTEMLRHFGVTAALGVMFAFVVTVVLLPPILLWVKKPALANGLTRGERAQGIPANAKRRKRRFEYATMRVTRVISDHPWPVVIVLAFAVGLSAWASRTVRVDSALLDQFEADDPIHIRSRLVENQLDGLRNLEIRVAVNDDLGVDDARLIRAVDRVTHWIDAQPEVTSTLWSGDFFEQTLRLLSGRALQLTGAAQAQDKGVRNDRAGSDAEEAIESEKGLVGIQKASQVRALRTLLSRGPESPLRYFLSEDGKQLRVQVKLRDVGARATSRFVARLSQRLDRALEPLPSASFELSGEAHSGSIGLDAAVQDLLWSLVGAVGIIFLMLALMFRSLRLSLIAMPPNIAPMVFTMAFMGILGIPLNAATAIIFSISMGLAVDSAIHLLARFREEMARGMSKRAALIRASRGTGRSIIVSNLTLMLGFSVLLLSSFVPIQRFGELVAVTIGGCTIATLVLLPALLMIGAKKTGPGSKSSGPTPSGPMLSGTGLSTEAAALRPAAASDPAARAMCEPMRG